MTEQEALNVCTQSVPVSVHFSKVNKLTFDISTLVMAQSVSIWSSVYFGPFKIGVSLRSETANRIITTHY